LFHFQLIYEIYIKIDGSKEFWPDSKVYKTLIFPVDLSNLKDETKFTKVEEETPDALEVAAKANEEREKKESAESIRFIYHPWFLSLASGDRVQHHLQIIFT
jgi:hypothetical protein